jgi:hypothetical protein
MKLNSKLLQVIKEDESEILLKYDTGHVEYFTPHSPVKCATLTGEIRKEVFSNSKPLSEKLDLIEEFIRGGEERDYQSPKKEVKEMSF